MFNRHANLRKAAVLIRTLDADTAATMLAQLTPQQAAALREAVRSLGPIDPEEQADVAAEFRRIRPLAHESARDGVELRLTSATAAEATPDRASSLGAPSVASKGQRFDFLEQAPIDALVKYLAREHVQTIAVVLSHLRPGRAATLLAALPEKLQADTIERLAALGETDPDSVIVLERELAAWLENRSQGRPRTRQCNETVTTILAAADSTTRSTIITNLRTHKAELAYRLAPKERIEIHPHIGSQELREQSPDLERSASSSPNGLSSRQSLAPAAARPIEIDFDQLIHLDGPTLAAVLRDVDTKVLGLALAGCREELLDRIGEQMPKRAARAFRRQLRRLGPTRLSDVEAAQRAVAQRASQHLAERRSRSFITAVPAATIA